MNLSLQVVGALSPIWVNAQGAGPCQPFAGFGGQMPGAHLG
jgi:hypothetical protein